MSSEPPTTGSSSGNAVSGAIKALPAWKKTAAVLSLTVAVVGAGGAGYAALADGGAEKSIEAAAERVPEGSETALVTGLVPTEGETTRTETDPREEEEISALSEWSPAIFRMGFAFFAGFCIAYAMRTFMKITIVVLGVCLLLIIGLQQAGIVDVNWAEMEERYDSVAGWLAAQTGSFKEFLTGYLPSSASATAGIVAGFKK